MNRWLEFIPSWAYPTARVLCWLLYAAAFVVGDFGAWKTALGIFGAATLLYALGYRGIEIELSSGHSGYRIEDQPGYDVVLQRQRTPYIYWPK